MVWDMLKLILTFDKRYCVLGSQQKEINVHAGFKSIAQVLLTKIITLLRRESRKLCQVYTFTLLFA